MSTIAQDDIYTYIYIYIYICIYIYIYVHVYINIWFRYSAQCGEAGLFPLCVPNAFLVCSSVQRTLWRCSSVQRTLWRGRAFPSRCRGREGEGAEEGEEEEEGKAEGGEREKRRGKRERERERKRERERERETERTEPGSCRPKVRTLYRESRLVSTSASSTTRPSTPLVTIEACAASDH